MLTVAINAKSAPFGALCFLFPIEDNFAGSPAAHDVEAFLEVIHFEVVSDNWADIKTRLDQARHLIPSFKHIAHHSILRFKINALMARPPSLGLKWGDSKQ